jgi:hypothetical protein
MAGMNSARIAAVTTQGMSEISVMSGDDCCGIKCPCLVVFGVGGLELFHLGSQVGQSALARFFIEEQYKSEAERNKRGDG